MIVEFVGPNGSGKATIIDELSRQLTNRGEAAETVSFRSTNVSLWQGLRNNPALARKVIRGPILTRRMRVIVRRDAMLQRLPATTRTLVDEGPRHGLMSLAASGQLSDIKEHLAALREPDIIVAMQADITVLLPRLRRKHDRHWSHDYNDMRLTERLARYLAIQDDFVRRTPIPVVYCANGPGSLTETATALLDDLLQLESQLRRSSQ